MPSSPDNGQPTDQALQELRDESKRKNEEDKAEEQRKAQTEPARKTKAKKREEEKNKQLRKDSSKAQAQLIAEEKERIKTLRESITDEIILAKMRPLRRYNAKKKCYTDDADKLMHTIQSAELTILKEGYTPEPAILSLPKKGWRGHPIRGLRESQHGPYYTKTDQVTYHNLIALSQCP